MRRRVTIGLDVSDRYSHLCVLDTRGGVEREDRMRTTPEAVSAWFARYANARIVLEVGPHSPWLSRLLKTQGHDVVVANPRRVRLIAEAERKSDRIDAETLARLGRADPKLLRPIEHRGAAAQQHLALLRVREGLVRSRTKLIQCARGLAKAFGTRLPASSAPSFAKRVREQDLEALFPGLDALLRQCDALTASIRELDSEVERLGRERYPETQLLRQVPGVGPITSLAYVLTIEDPNRFAKSRSVGAYLGLTPRQRESGEARSELAITKRGDELLRRLLIEAAHYTLGPFGSDSELRRFGLRLAGQGGKRAKKRAVVAVARKLATLLHRLWVTGEVYHAFGAPSAEVRAA
ncbi:MAG: IS110 family transposase [Sorangiineae bacterium PRO1]|nr:IS110 family transposase [Sorangiineae bacterium PRO1]